MGMLNWEKPLTKFEQSFAKLIGTRYAIGVNSGNDAVKVPQPALKMLGNEKGIFLLVNSQKTTFENF